MERLHDLRDTTGNVLEGVGSETFRLGFTLDIGAPDYERRRDGVSRG